VALNELSWNPDDDGHEEKAEDAERPRAGARPEELADRQAQHGSHYEAQRVGHVRERERHAVGPELVPIDEVGEERRGYRAAGEDEQVGGDERASANGAYS